VLTAFQLDVLTDPLAELYSAYEESIIRDISRRLGKMEMTATAAWQMQRLVESGKVYENALEEIAKLTNISEATLKQMFEKAGVKAMRFDDSVYRAAGLDPLPLNMSPAMAQVLAAGLQKTNGIMRNLTMTTAMAGQEAFISAADLAYMQVSTGAMSYTEAIRDAVKGVATNGLNVITYAGRQDQLDVAVRRAVLTGINQTSGKLTEARANQMGCDLVQTSAHVGARPEHQVWQGQVFSRSGTHPKYPPFVESTGYGTATGLEGVNCVLGDTLVSGPAICAGYRRKYSGEIVIIRTASGKELSVTPNHPILTDHGWVAAGLLKDGDNVISRSGLNGMNGISPNVDNREPTIQDVFMSLFEGGDVLRLPVSAGHFHGDISDSEIDVVFPNSQLRDRNNPAFTQKPEEIAFSSAFEFSGQLFADGSLDKVAFTSLRSSHSGVGGLGEPGSTLCSSPFEPVPHSVRPAFCQRDTHVSEVLPDQAFGNASSGSNFIFPQAGIVQRQEGVWGDMRFAPQVNLPISRTGDAIPLDAVLNSMEGAPIFISDRLIGLSGEEEIDNIIFIKRKYLSSTHVYNLETEDGWYFANGIITHNCRHSHYPFFEGISENVYSKSELDSYAGKNVTYNGKEIPIYEATQQQRYIERKIRHWKRQAGALEAAGQEFERETGKVLEWQAAMRDFIRQTRLQRDRIREQI
jgi:hypothetical protein